jgi:predicted small metal-binding protein
LKTFACKDLGMDCSFVASGSTVEEVKEKAIAHAQVVHIDMLATMTPAQMNDLVQAVEKNIRTVMVG